MEARIRPDGTTTSPDAAVELGLAVKRLQNPRKARSLPESLDPELGAELESLRRAERLRVEETDRDFARRLTEAEYKEAGALVECKCCYGEFPLEEMAQCDDGHTFCCGCCRSAAKAAMDQGLTLFKCLSSDGCEFGFPRSQIQKFLPEREFEAYMGMVGAEEIRKAGLKHLEECPFCPFKAIVEDENDKVFHCLNPKCGRESCRRCHQLNHLPLSCSEVTREKREDSLRLAVEKAMDDARIRRCPGCQKDFIKEEGCNFIHCPCGFGFSFAGSPFLFLDPWLTMIIFTRRVLGALWLPCASDHGVSL